MTYKYYLDGVLLVDEPQGWSELTDKIERVDILKGIFITQEATLTFWGDGYNLLFGKFSVSFCGLTTIDIEESCDGVIFENIFTGIIFISDCEFDYNKCYCTSKVQDNSFYAKINNNKSIKTYLEVGTSKNGTTFSSADNYQIEIFNPCDATYYAAPRTPHAVRVYEAFRVLIAFMTDDTVGFYSSYFGLAGDARGDCITDGIHLSSLLPAQYTAALNINKICFLDLFREMDAKYNLGMKIDYTLATPTLVIEPMEVFRQKESVLTLNNINGLKASIDSDKLYAQVRFGGKTAIGNGCPAPGLAFPNDKIFTTFKEENFYVIGECNIDKTFDIYGQWIVDSNIIQDCVVNGTEDYDDEIFIIQTDFNTINSGTSTKGNPFNISPAVFPRYYNEKFMNDSVSQRFLGGIPNSIAQALNNLVDQFYAHRTQTDTFANMYVSPTYTYVPIQFNDDSTPPYNDAGGNFNLGTGRYTALVTGGIYAFYFSQRFKILSNDSPYVGYDANNYHAIQITLTLTHYDSVGNILNTSSTVRTLKTFDPTGDNLIVTNAFYSINFSSKVFTLSINDYVDATITFQLYGVGNCVSVYFHSGVDIVDALFKTIYTSLGGGEVAGYDPDDYPAYIFRFQYPLTTNEFNTLLAQPEYAITLNVDGSSNFNAFLESVSYKRKTGIADFVCSNQKNMTT